MPFYFAWLFKYDCMDAVWWSISKGSRGSLPRPRYNSDEVGARGHETIHIIASYRLLVCATVVIIGMLEAGLTYTGDSTEAKWVEWLQGVIISSLCVSY